MTLRIFEKEPMQLEFNARILNARKSEKGWQVRLDQTAFYPEGGGQPADHGTLGGIPVIDVQEKEGEIIHLLTASPSGDEVLGVVDGERRRDFMQQHTGQHILSAAFWITARLVTASVHMGSDVTTIDLETPDLTNAQLEAALDLADRVIAEDRPLDAVEALPEELPRYSPRKPAPVDGPVRLVRIRDFDCVGCCGLHLPSTGAVRLAVCVGRERIRGMVRTVWKIGDRAVRDLRTRVEIMNEMRALLGTRDGDLPAIVKRHVKDAVELRADIGHLEGRLGKLLAEILIDSPDGSASGATSMVARILENESPGIAKTVIKELLARENLVFVIINRQDEGMSWSLGIPPGHPLDFATLKTQVLDRFNARGGGRAPLWQGSAPDPARAPDLLDALEQTLQSSVEPPHPADD